MAIRNVDRQIGDYGPGYKTGQSRLSSGFFVAIIPENLRNFAGKSENESIAVVNRNEVVSFSNNECNHHRKTEDSFVYLFSMVYLHKLLTLLFPGFLLVGCNEYSQTACSDLSNTTQPAVTELVEAHALPGKNEPLAHGFTGRYTIPEELILIETRPVHWSDRKQGTDEYYHDHVDQFFPIGWSEDGSLFAYFLVEDQQQECGCTYSYGLMIQDPTDDKGREWWRENHSDSHTFTKGIVWTDHQTQHALTNFSIADHWSANETLYQEKLAEYKIIQRYGFRMEKFPSSEFYDEPAVVDCDLHFSECNDIGMCNKLYASVELHEYSGGPVLDAHKLYEDDYYEFSKDAKLLGYIENPVSPRKPLIIWTIRQLGHAFENPPRVNMYTLAGVNLDEAFD